MMGAMLDLCWVASARIPPAEELDTMNKAE